MESKHFKDISRWLSVLKEISEYKNSEIKFRNFSISDANTYQVSILSTMSSGKSTFLNALIGEDILPVSNQACTGKVLRILDNNEAERSTAHVIYNNEHYEKITTCVKDVIQSYQMNNEKGIKELLIETSIRGVQNTDCSLLLVDTPGINNAGDARHEEETVQYIETLNEGLILYLMNVSQLGTTDELKYLTMVEEKVRSSPLIKILFIMNKMDYVDPEVEKPSNLMRTCKNYLQSIGFNSPQMIPVSSEVGLLFRKVLSDKKLTLSEFYKFNTYMNLFEPKGYNLMEYALVEDRPSYEDTVFVSGIEYQKSKIYLALENTGIPLVEKKIEEYLVESQKYRSPKINY